MRSHLIKDVLGIISLVILISIPAAAYAKRIVKGKITDKNGNPAADVRVKVMDSDFPLSDQEMCKDMSDADGIYECQYEGKPNDEWWDWSPFKGWTFWRPDIYIKVSAPVNGWCEEGKWDKDRNWKYLGESEIESNHPMRDDHTENLRLNDYPLREVKMLNFIRGDNMYCNSTIFRFSCFGCSDEKDKIEWGDWGFGGPPQTATRCWFPPNPQCSDEDYEKIQDGGFTGRVDPQRHNPGSNPIE